MANKLYAAHAPHVNGDLHSNRMMRDVIFALLPALLISVFYFGADALYVIGVAVASSLFFEYVIRKFVMKDGGLRGDLSSVVTGMLLAFNVPASIPLWIVVIGSFVAIVIAKMTFGGLGCNPFNPALVGRVFLLIAYPVQMTSFPEVIGGVDTFSGATPLAAVKSDAMGAVTKVDFQDMLFGSIPGSLGEVAALLLLLGGVYLLMRKVITWHIPVAVLGTMFVFAALYGYSDGFDLCGALLFALFHILAGGAMLGAIYMATDYASSPMNKKAMLIYGVGIGVITMCIRLWGSYPEGISFAILIMNAVVPLINKYVKPRRYGVK
ncbi:MAG: RnfABCDGE type electron transport complex subunit D [Rikenellaceae bacterium]